MAKKSTTKHLKLEWFGDEMAAAVEQATEPGLWALGGIVLAEAQRRAPSDTGRLRRSGFIATSERNNYRRQSRDRRTTAKVRKNEVMVRFASYYGRIFEGTGAKEHAIPKQSRRTATGARKVLLIPGVGFRRSVQHPGVRRRPFVAPALEAVKGRAVDALVAVLGKEIVQSLPRGE